MYFKAYSPLMVRLAYKLVIKVEILGIDTFWGRYISGIRNILANKFLRISEGHPIPACLYDSHRVVVPELEHVFRVWP